LKTNDMIQNLSQNLAPVQKFSLGFKNYALAAAVAFACIGAGVAINGVRFNFNIIALTPHYIFECLLLLGLAVSSVSLAFQLSLPGDIKKSTWSFFLATLLGWAFLTVYLLFNYNKPVADWGFHCSEVVFFTSLIPAAVLFLTVKSAAVLNRAKTGFVIWAGSAALGALVNQVICPSEDPMHLLIWHVLPVFIIGFLGTGLAKLVLKRI
jgi:hypothetical protein